MSSTTLDLSVGKLSQVITRTNAFEYTNEMTFTLDIPPNLWLMEVYMIGGGGGGQGSSGNGSNGTPSLFPWAGGVIGDGEYAGSGQGGGISGSIAFGGNSFVWDDVNGQTLQYGLAGKVDSPARGNLFGNAGNGGEPFAGKVGGGNGGILHRFFTKGNFGGLTSLLVTIGRGGIPSLSGASPGSGGACIIKIYTK